MMRELQNSGKSALKAVNSQEDAYSTGSTALFSRCAAKLGGSSFPICHSRACKRLLG